MKHILLIITLLIMSCNGSTKKSKNEVQKASITGNYQVISIADVQELSLTSENITMKFTEQGKVNGNNSCNNYSANYSLTKGSISFGMIISTKKFCQETAEIETAFMRNLAEVDNYKIDKDKLFLLKGETRIIEAKKVENSK